MDVVSPSVLSESGEPFTPFTFTCKNVMCQAVLRVTAANEVTFTREMARSQEGYGWDLGFCGFTAECPLCGKKTVLEKHLGSFPCSDATFVMGSVSLPQPVRVTAMNAWLATQG